MSCVLYSKYVLYMSNVLHMSFVLCPVFYICPIYPLSNILNMSYVLCPAYLSCEYFKFRFSESLNFVKGRNGFDFIDIGSLRKVRFSQNLNFKLFYNSKSYCLFLGLYCLFVYYPV